MLAAIALATPFVLAGEQSFFHIPGADEFRLQRITKSENESGWPFTVEEGYLSCAYVMGRRVAYFTEIAPEGADLDDLRTVIVSTDPLDLVFGNLGHGGLLATTDTVEALIALMAPFEQLGQRLCDQPPGTQVRPGEL